MFHKSTSTGHIHKIDREEGFTRNFHFGQRVTKDPQKTGTRVPYHVRTPLNKSGLHRTKVKVFFKELRGGGVPWELVCYPKKPSCVMNIDQ